jgi:hypothetical protein
MSARTGEAKRFEHTSSVKESLKSFPTLELLIVSLSEQVL